MLPLNASDSVIFRNGIGPFQDPDPLKSALFRFADGSDLILLMFDYHTLDISAELQEVLSKFDSNNSTAPQLFTPRFIGKQPHNDNGQLTAKSPLDRSSRMAAGLRRS